MTLEARDASSTAKDEGSESRHSCNNPTHYDLPSLRLRYIHRLASRRP